MKKKNLSVKNIKILNMSNYLYLQVHESFHKQNIKEKLKGEIQKVSLLISHFKIKSKYCSKIFFAIILTIIINYCCVNKLNLNC